MCGIAGYIDFRKRTPVGTIDRMIRPLGYRGPDDRGIHCLDNRYATVALGQTRLAILDLTAAGHQPMHYKNLVTVMNGEIYNFREIRQELESYGHRFVSHSDTEVILHAYDYWGKDFVHRLIGMFVIVIYSQDEERLLILRDRAGVKPLYYYWKHDCLMFGSELKALFMHPAFQKKLDPAALPLYFDFGYIPAPWSIFQDTRKLDSGSYLAVDLKERSLSTNRYWSIHSFYGRKRFAFGYPEAREQLQSLLSSAFNYRMVSDVPVGVFLSGGYDSSLVTAMLQAERTDRLKTFTIGFEGGNNEMPFAGKIARFLQTDHTAYLCTSREAQQIIPDLPYIYDEPFADSSAIPTILVSRIAGKDVKVALSADAGDELFAGYTSYATFTRNLRLLEKLPVQSHFMMREMMSLLAYLTPAGQSQIKHKLLSVSRAIHADRTIQAGRLRQLSAQIPVYFRKRIFRQMTVPHDTGYTLDFSSFDNTLDMALAIDYDMYLQNDIFTKVDRATMSVSIEGREPLADHRIAEFAAQLPLEYRFNSQTGKRILKDIAHDYLPRELVDRPKTGFSLPVYQWLNGDLAHLLDTYLNRRAIDESKLFQTDHILHIVDRFKRNKFYYKPLIWKLLMFQMWYSRWMKKD